MVVNRMPLPEKPESLIIGVASTGDAGAGVKSLPDIAVICSCENITKGALVQQVKDGNATTLDHLKKSTKACTGCGGCTPMVQDILKLTMESLGITVKKT